MDYLDFFNTIFFHIFDQESAMTHFRCIFTTQET